MSNHIVNIINPADYENWNDEIQRFGCYSFFHTVEWSKVLSKTYNYKPTYFTLIKNGRISSVLPAMEVNSKLTGNRLVSLPFSDFCDPLINSDEDSDLLKESIMKYCTMNRLRYMEFRISETSFPFETEHFRTDLRHLLDISVNQDELQKHLSDNTKRNIKSAIKEGIDLKELNSPHGIETFYKLQCITRRKHGLPPQPKSFFENIYTIIISNNMGQILFAYLKERPVAALMFFTIGDKVLYKFGSSLTDNLPKGTNHFLMWEAIRKYKNAGYKEFDFGRTETNHEGLRRFKVGFGAAEKMIFTTKFDIRKNSFIKADIKTSGFHNKIFSRLPLSTLKLIGNLLYKHIG